MRANPPLDYSFYTTCVSADGDEINRMKAAAHAVTYETMLAHCRGMLDYAASLGYERRSTSGHGLTLKHDWHVGYYKGQYGGCPVYYFAWSNIEHIWVKDGCEPHVESDVSYDSTILRVRHNPRDLPMSALSNVDPSKIAYGDEEEGAFVTPLKNPAGAAARCEAFHGDGACRDYVEKKLWMPGEIVLMGDCIDCGYDVTNRRSEKDGRYVHDHKSGVKLYRRANGDERPSKTLTPPRQVFVLGNWLGCTYDDGTGKRELNGSSRIKACTDNGKRLFAIHATKGCLYVISGGSFRIRDWMYD